MRDFFNKIKLKLAKARQYVPTRLPIGLTDFHLWADDIIVVNGLPSNDSVRFALATMVLHLEAVSKIELNFLFFKIQIFTSAYKSKQFFAQGLLKSAANQVAAGHMHDLKEKQKAEQERLKMEAAAAVVL